MLEPKQHWLDVINRHPARFSIGSDLCGHFEHLGRNLARYNSLLRDLPPKVRRLVASQNAEKLWFARRPGPKTAKARAKA
jgi:hypothetical protein